MEQIETTLPEGLGTYVVTSIIVDQGTNHGAFHIQPSLDNNQPSTKTAQAPATPIHQR